MATLKELFDRTTSSSHEKATRSHIFALRPRKGSVRRVVFLVKSSEKYSSPAGHLVTILWPTIPDMRTVDPADVDKAPTTTRVRVNCSCPAYKFTGPAYHSNKFKYRLPGTNAEERPPVERDPLGERLVCKHILRCTEELSHIDFVGLAQIFYIRGPRRSSPFLPGTTIQVKAIYDSVHLLEPTVKSLIDISDEDYKRLFSDITENTWEDLFEELGLIPRIEDM